MSRSVKLDTEGLRERQARAQEPAAPARCEAERRILMALHTMEIDWGSGMFDYGKIRGILAGRETGNCACEPGQGDPRKSADCG